MGMIMIQCKYTTHYTYNNIVMLHCVATMLYILVNIDQDELKLHVVLVNIT